MNGLQRIKDDPFHWMDRLTSTISKDSPHRSQISMDLSNALFTHDPWDTANVQRYLAKKGEHESIEAYLKAKGTSGADWVNVRVKRTIPRPELLEPRLDAFYMQYRDLKDAGGKPVLTETSHAAWKGMMAAVRDDLVSDVPGVELYSTIGVVDELPVYECARGTNKNETLHNKMNEEVNTENCSIQLADHLVANKAYNYNINKQVARGHIPDFGHSDLHMVDLVQMLSLAANGEPHYPNYEVNDLDLQGERIGVTRVTQIDTSQQLPKVAGKEIKLSGDLAFLAKHTGSAVPHTPIIGKAEHDLFVKLKREEPAARMSQMVDTWDQHVDPSAGIYRKSTHHLAGYDKIHTKSNLKWAGVRQMTTTNGMHNGHGCYLKGNWVFPERYSYIVRFLYRVKLGFYHT